MKQKAKQDNLPDAAAILGDLREQIRERRARLSTYEAGSDSYALSLGELRESVEAVNDTWHVSAHLPITWDVPIAGRLGSYIKRVVRIMLRWYINPIIEQQNRYNQAVARAIVALHAYNERLAREWQALDERVEALEEQVADEESGDGN
jgi:hypothetical protein